MGMGSLPMDGKPERRNKWPYRLIVCLLLNDVKRKLGLLGRKVAMDNSCGRNTEGIK
jgi:hypothetical protein